MITTTYLFKTGSIQDKVVQSLINEVKKKYSTDISFDSYDLSFKEGIVLNNVLLKDHFNDTLVYVKNLKTNLKSIQNIAEGEIRFSSLHLDGLIINVKKYSVDKINSLQSFVKLLKSKKDNTKISSIIYVSSFKIDNSEIRFPNSNDFFKIFKLKSSNLIVGPDFIESNFIDGEFEALKINSFYF